VLKVLFFLSGFHQSLFFSVHDCTGFKHGFFDIFDFNLISRRQMLDLVFKFLNYTIQPSDFHTFFVQSLIHLVFFISVVLLDIVDALIQLFDLLIQLVSLGMPLFSLFLLPFQPFGMLSLDIIKLAVQFINSSLVETLHLLNLQVKVLNFFALATNGLLEIALLFHELFHVDASVLEELSMRNVSQ
jgi:hypothetical protein